MSQLIGIDLGTTNTVISYLKDSIPRILPNHLNSNTTPSIVSYFPKLLVGAPAKTQKDYISSVKRLIGRKFSNEFSHLPYVYEHKNGDVWIKSNNRKISPVEVSSDILKYVKNCIDNFFKRDNVKDVVITVPAYFDDMQRQATKDAGRIAGFNVLRVVNEPTAAALAYGLDKSVDATVAVYDLGGGTFDISILEIKDGVFEVLSTNGNVSLGGDDIDREIMDDVIKRYKETEKKDDTINYKESKKEDVVNEKEKGVFNEKDGTFNYKENKKGDVSNEKEKGVYNEKDGTSNYKEEFIINNKGKNLFNKEGNKINKKEDCKKEIDFNNSINNNLINHKNISKKEKDLDDSFLIEIKEGVENLKKELSGKNESYIKVNNILIKYTRKEIEAIAKKIIDKTIDPCLQAIKDAKINKKEIKHVILVGGATRMPLVQKTVREIFGKEPDTSIDPDEAVAKGAAIQAGILKGCMNDIILLDVTSLSLGIETVGGIFSKIIKRNTTIPTKQTQIFTTSEDYHDEVEIKIFQGERPLVKHNKFLGEIKIKNIKPMKKGEPRIEISFESDANGIYKVTARDLIHKTEQFLEIKPDGGLSDIEIKKIIEDANKNKERDEKILDCNKVRIEAKKILETKKDFEIERLIENEIFDIDLVKKKLNELLKEI